MIEGRFAITLYHQAGKWSWTVAVPTEKGRGWKGVDTSDNKSFDTAEIALEHAMKFSVVT